MVPMRLKMKADAPMPEMIAPCTVPLAAGNHRPPVMNGIWYARPTPRPKSTLYESTNWRRVVAYEARKTPEPIITAWRTRKREREGRTGGSAHTR